MSEKYAQYIFVPHRQNAWSVEYENLDLFIHQTLFTICNKNIEPLLHVTAAHGNLIVGYYDGSEWQHIEKYSHQLSIERVNYLRCYVTSSNIIIYFNDCAIADIPLSVVMQASFVTIGVHPQMKGEQYPLAENVSFKVHENIQDDYRTSLNNKHNKTINIDIDKPLGVSIGFKDILHDQILCVFAEDDDTTHVSIKIAAGTVDFSSLDENIQHIPIHGLAKHDDRKLWLDILWDNHYVYFFVNNELLIFRWKRILDKCTKLIVNANIDGEISYTFPSLAKLMPEDVDDTPILSIVVSVYIHDYSHFAKTINCLHNIQKHTKVPYEIILVDDGSDCNYFILWRNDSPWFKENVHILSNNENIGIAKSRNIGASHTRGDYIVFLDNDQTVQEGWDDIYLSLLRDNHDCIIGEHRKYDAKLYMSIQTSEDEVISEHSYINGGGMALSKHLFFDLNGFNEVFSPMYCEDVDISWRALDRGCCLLPLSLDNVARHDNMFSTIDRMPKSTEYLLKNNEKLLMMYKDKFPSISLFDKKSKDRALFLVNSTNVGGAENALSNILMTDAIEKHVIVLRETDTWLRDKMIKYADNFLSLDMKHGTNAILQYCLINKIDLVVFNNFNYDLRLQLIDRIKQYAPQIKVIDVICDNWYWDNINKFAERLKYDVNEYLESIDHFICKNRSMEKSLLSKNIRNVTVIYNGIDNSHNFSYLSHKDGKEFTAITVSRISPEKRLNLILDMARKLPTVKFIIIGGPSGEYRQQYYEEMKSESDKLDNVHMLGELPKHEVMEKLAMADVFVFASESEGCPNVLLEAMSVGVPIVAMNATGVTEIVNDDIGYLVDDVNEAVNAIMQLQCDPWMAKRKSENARRIANDKYSLQQMIDNYVNVFLSAINDDTNGKKKTSRVCILVPTLGVGGAEKVALEQVEYLNSAGIDCDMWYFSDYYSEFVPDDSLKEYIHKGDMSPHNLIEKTSYSLYISHIIPAKELLEVKDKKIINAVHSPSFWLRSGNDIARIMCDKHIIYHCLSNFVYSMLAPYIYNNMFFILPHGVRVDRDISKESAREMLGIDKDTFVISNIGKNSKVKNVSKLLDIFETLTRYEDAKLLLIGDMTMQNDNCDTSIMERINDNSNIIYKGVVHDHVQEYLAASDCYVNTSWSEGLPISIMEALSVGVPCVSHNVGAINEIVANGETGYLLSVDCSSNEFVDAIMKARNIDKEACIRIVNEKYNFDINMSKLCSIVNNLR